MARLIQPGLMPVCVSVVYRPHRCANTQLWNSVQPCHWVGFFFWLLLFPQILAAWPAMLAINEYSPKVFSHSGPVACLLQL